MKRYIYLLRHGETEFGKEKRYLGHIDCNLSSEGKYQAMRLGDIFKENKIEIKSIFSSDLIRCKDTIKLVFQGREVTYLRELREINMGIWDGLTFDEVKSKYAEDYINRGKNISNFIPRNGESFIQCQMRAIAVFKEIICLTTGNIAICGHSGFIRALLCNLLNKDLKEIFDIKQSYGGINIITAYNHNFVVEGINLKNVTCESG
ncbi:histidine phosphatase family protein [Clostridium saccharoperbutylacetonicum]|uniref:histidine phosphatase family protein n=1 Tax=Clostridium saccharoperbutylacetonicum TaxID=36745 RepID=UPI0039E7EA81